MSRVAIGGPSNSFCGLTAGPLFNVKSRKAGTDGTFQEAFLLKVERC